MKSSASPQQSRRTRAQAALAGLLAGGLTLGVAELIAALVAPASAPILVVGAAFIDRTPGFLKDFAIETFGTNDKLVLILTMVLTIALLSAVAGILSWKRPLFGVGLVVLLGAVGALAGVTRANATFLYALPSVIGGIFGILALLWMIRTLRRTTRERLGNDTSEGSTAAPLTNKKGLPDILERRSFLFAAGATALVGAAAGAGGRILSAATRNVGEIRTRLGLPAPQNAAAPLPEGVMADVEGISPFVTPNDDFYRIDTALSVPRIVPEEWSLRVHGMVEEPFELNYQELLDLGLTESWITLTCVSNEIGGSLIGNAKWLGYPLHRLLERARPQSSADMVLSSSIDGFTAGTPLEALQDEERGALLAVGMNDEPLPLEHGFPVRMIVPGLYGFVSATKWVVDLEVTRYADKTAYWTDRGWAEKAPIKTMSRIDVPDSFERFEPGSVAVGGVAWAQIRGIEKVEVQVDNGPWEEATLSTELNTSTWRQWSYVWEATSGGHTLRVRATDQTGETQTDEVVRPIPNGASGWHSVFVQVN